VQMQAQMHMQTLRARAAARATGIRDELVKEKR
jgi:hypothetical protein